MNQKLNKFINPFTIFFIAVFITVVRSRTRLIDGHLWAEDAAIFLKQAYEIGGFESIRTQYNGYIHFIPRVIALLVADFGSIYQAPFVFPWVCLIIISLSCSYLFSAFRSFPPRVALILGLSPVLSPLNGEILLSLTNIQWFLCAPLLVLLWEFIYKPPLSHSFIRIIALFSLVLTGPFGVILWPAVLVAMVIRKLEGHFIKILSKWFVVYTWAVLFQVLELYSFFSHQVPVKKMNWLSIFIKPLFVDLIPVPLLHLLGSYQFVLGLILFTAFILISIGCKSWRATCFLFCFSVSLWFLGVSRDNAPTGNLLCWYGYGARYMYISILFLWWIPVLVSLTETKHYLKRISIFLASIIFFTSMSRFRVEKYRMWEISKNDTSIVVTVPPGWVINIQK